jgi:hypothetical protein
MTAHRTSAELVTTKLFDALSNQSGRTKSALLMVEFLKGVVQRRM